jgi:hypothetical protein
MQQAASPIKIEPNYQVHSESVSSGSDRVGRVQGAACAQNHDILEGKIIAILILCQVV